MNFDFSAPGITELALWEIKTTLRFEVCRLTYIALLEKRLLLGRQPDCRTGFMTAMR